jgi:hypothetical protein
MFRLFGIILRVSTVEETCFRIAKLNNFIIYIIYVEPVYMGWIVIPKLIQV